MNNHLADLITVVFSALILISPYLIRIVWKKRNFSPKEIIGVAATLGILGTFIGIFIALQSFDVSNINGSIPAILSGLKTAFATSIVGMIVGLIVKFIPFVYGIQLEESIEAEDDNKGIIQLLKEMNYNSKIGNQDLIFQLKNIEKALTGDGDTTLLSQIQKLRTSMMDKQDELINEFKIFGKHVAENSSKAIVEALTQVIRDFNDKITEQFGENFKHLNDGVGKMLEWQNNYKEHIQVASDKLNETLEIMKSTQKLISNVVTKAEKFAEISDKLGLSMDLIMQHNTELQSGIKQFAELSKEAVKAIPTIEKNISAMTKEFSESVNHNVRMVNELLSKQQNNVNEQISNLVKQQEVFNKTLEAQIKETNGAMAKQFTEFDKLLGEQLNKSIESLGSNLIGLSNRFVQDYTPLTERLSSIIRLAEGVRN